MAKKTSHKPNLVRRKGFGWLRNVALPAPVDVQSAVASYSDGILIVRMNKLPVNKMHRVSVISAK